KNIDTTPDEKVRQLQRELNESGYTDKFGQKLKEDGIYGGKTAYADDRRMINNTGKTHTNINNNSTITDSKRYDIVTLNASGKAFNSQSFASAGGSMLNIKATKNAYKTNSAETTQK
ncbi:MAG: hypothetical protein UH854_02440, partial [Clostridia bacterium]|nr:hypothetical protein [Clostridia bacterium]